MGNYVENTLTYSWDCTTRGLMWGPLDSIGGLTCQGFLEIFLKNFLRRWVRISYRYVKGLGETGVNIFSAVGTKRLTKVGS